MNADIKEKDVDMEQVKKNVLVKLLLNLMQSLKRLKSDLRKNIKTVKRTTSVRFSYTKKQKGSDNMKFGRALEALKNGMKVARTGWNGDGMWLRLVKPDESEIDYGYEHLPYIEMKTADNKLVPWLASQTDMLAKDWTIIE